MVSAVIMSMGQSTGREAAREVEVRQSSTVCDRNGCYEPAENGDVDAIARDDLFRDSRVGERMRATDVDTTRMAAVERALESVLCESQLYLIERAQEREGLFELEGLQSVAPSPESRGSVRAELRGDDGVTFSFEFDFPSRVQAERGDRVFFHYTHGDAREIETQLISVEEIRERCGQ